MYLQNSVSIVPATSELAENMRWIADGIRDMGGESYVFRATTTSPGEEGEIERLFGSVSRTHARKLLEALSVVERRVRRTTGSQELEEFEDEVQRIRQAALKLRLRSHFPSPEEETLHKRVRAVRERLDRQALRRPGRR
jgi:hypothetical protein